MRVHIEQKRYIMLPIVYIEILLHITRVKKVNTRIYLKESSF